MMGAGAQEGPRESYQPLARIGTDARTITGRNRHQLRMQRAINDVSRIQFEGIFVPRGLGQNHSRVQRAQPTRRPVCYKVDINELLRVAPQVCRSRRLSAGINLPLSRSEMFFDLLHLSPGFRQLAVLTIGSYRVTDEQQFPRTRAW